MGRDSDSSARKGSRHQRIVARTVFGATVAVLLAVAGLPLGLSLAQVGPEIQIINPHPGVPSVLADKGQPFHLNSWVNVVPPNPLVEFELDVRTDLGPVPGDTETINIGPATQSGNSFSLPWDIEDSIEDEVDPPESLHYTLRAILYTGFTTPGTGVEVSRDEMEVTINHKGDDAGENVEISYPTNNGPLGVYIRPDGSGGNFTMEAEVSSGTRFVRTYYTISEPGEEPVWETCTSGYSSVSTRDDGSKFARVRCSTNAGDYALDVNAVAFVTNDTPQVGAGNAQPDFNDGSDAHVVTPYYQHVASLELTPATVNDAPFGGNLTLCTQFLVEVLDDQGRPIGNMNIDVAAQGPSDQLKFDTFTGTGAVSSANKPPDKNHSGGGEPAVSCHGGDRSGGNGTQGEHNVPGGSDVKHIESTGGTDANGEFEFALIADRTGSTQVTAYADEDDDDRRCSQEKSDDASIGWGQNAPAATGVSTETDSCTVTTPSPTPTPTESGSTSPPPSSGTQEPKERHDRDITINFSHGSLIVSGKVSVDGGPNKCRSDVVVQVQRRENKKWRTKKTVRTNGSGEYSATLRDKQGRYRARAPKETMGNDVCLLTTVVKRHDH